jgi:hypothetical protein
VANLKLFLNNQLTSCIMSQVVMALHFLYVSCRSRHGRGWAYASLRFELDERGGSTLLEGMATATKRSPDGGAGACAATPMLGSGPPAAAPLQRAGAARVSMLHGVRDWWRELQRRQVSRCRVFLIPCVRLGDGGGGGQGEVVLARPAFGLRWLAPLQRLADAHPRMYFFLGSLFLGVPPFVISSFVLRGQAKGISRLVLNFLVLIMALGFASSKRYNLDRVAVKHVLLSFRFLIIAFLLAIDISLNIRLVITSDMHVTDVIAYVLAVLFFCLCILMDCTPHLPPAVQILISVYVCDVCNVTFRSVCLLSLSAGGILHCLRILWFSRISTSGRRQ